MNVYLLFQGERGNNAQKVNVYFFKRSALAAARRAREQGGDWQSVTDHETSATDFWITSALWMSIIPVFLLFRDWSLRRWIRDRAHWQNLNEDREGKVKGSILREGRAWFRPFGYGSNRRQVEFEWSWRFWTDFWALEVEVGSGDCNDGIAFWIAFGLLSFHFEIQHILPKAYIERGRQRALKTEWMGYEYMAWPRKTGIGFHDQTIWFAIWNWDAGWDHRQPKWMNFNFCPVDFLLGKTIYTSKSLTDFPKRKRVLMPEGLYPVDVTLTEDTWKRPRWPWPHVVRRAQIECPIPIPTPGKGENSWDCGEDATYGLTCPASTINEALSMLKESVMQDRERYGGKNWKPQAAKV